jgi:glutathione S-transferase
VANLRQPDPQAEADARVANRQARSICDPYLFTLAQFLEGDGVDPARFPNVLDFRNRMAARPAVQRALADELG